ncbi:hypothetical protein JHK86_007031 [Glycine max]|nr:hypothetical protein JHK86_007031 [Glycine max]
MRHGESQGNHDTTMYTTIPDHNIQSTAQGMTQALRAEKHLRRDWLPRKIYNECMVHGA